MLLGITLGNIAETNFRRSMAMSNGSISIFFTRPICAGFLLLTAASMCVFFYKERQDKKKKNAASGGE